MDPRDCRPAAGTTERTHSARDTPSPPIRANMLVFPRRNAPHELAQPPYRRPDPGAQPR
ncbi:hypothetical protein BN1263190169 [Stenotrophomonas maltophilia]|nr:hypothetical protein BN1263190169 [Stenotrophomonas maltophilia]